MTDIRFLTFGLTKKLPSVSNERQLLKEILNSELGSPDDVILIFAIQFAKIAAPTPHANNEVGVLFGMLLRI